ncbi:MAG: ABC transporter ATP-binding protein [Pirellulales bacterium]|nr:ABC transporter ATP-binding protein [Pirellulales bacterium]
MAEALIVFRAVDFAYGPERPVLRQCDFRLEPGERLAIAGPNGSGKTTLLHLIVGLLRLQRGEIEIFGKPRRKEGDFHEVRRRAGLLFQEADDQLFCPTVLEDVAFGPLNLGYDRDAVRRIVAQTLEELGLAGYEHRITYQLSGGEKRLVALAAVLAMQPEVLLFDEPTAGLDETSRRRLLEILLGLPQSMIVVSHDWEFREAIAGRTLFLREGRLD